MMVRFRPIELPIAYSMIKAAKRLKRYEDKSHPFQKYFYYWIAFNNIYTTIAYTGNRSTILKKRPDGSVQTEADGNVQIPKVKTVTEKEQIALAFAEFDDDLKHQLITHSSTDFFVKRTPSWDGKEVTIDALGQRVNGVINVNYTVDINHPVWSPIDPQLYSQYLDYASWFL